VQNGPFRGLIDRHSSQERPYDRLPFLGLTSIENRSKMPDGSYQFVHDAVQGGCAILGPRPHSGQLPAQPITLLLEAHQRCPDARKRLRAARKGVNEAGDSPLGFSEPRFDVLCR
jgi:hypothetical protein